LFWNPDHEHLPAEEWAKYRGLLSGYGAELGDTYDLIEDAYQECNQLNIVVRDQVAEARHERKTDTLTTYAPGYEFTFGDGDEARVRAVEAKLAAALEAINERVAGASN